MRIIGKAAEHTPQLKLIEITKFRAIGQPLGSSQHCRKDSEKVYFMRAGQTHQDILYCKSRRMNGEKQTIANILTPSHRHNKVWTCIISLFLADLLIYPRGFPRNVFNGSTFLPTGFFPLPFILLFILAFLIRFSVVLPIPTKPTSLPVMAFFPSFGNR